MRWRIVPALFLVFILGRAPAAQGSTIFGSVADDGGSLPGVVVELSGQILPKPLNAVTDGKGVFRFSSISDGIYTVTATFAGGSPVVVPNIRVKGARPVQLDAIVFRTETVKVEAALEPLLKMDTTTAGATFLPEKLSTLPTARTYTEVLKLAPGVSGDDGSGGQVVYGSTGLESSYIIDGINTTSVESGLPSKKLGFSLIDKLDIKTGGYEAEFGGAQGAIVNVTTKSGTNQFGGDADFYYGPSTLASEAKTNDFGTSAPSPEYRELSGSLGGPIVRDKVFFFASASRIFQNSLADQRNPDLFGRTVAESTEQSSLYSLKVNWQMSGNASLTAVLLSDPKAVSVRDALGGVGGDRTLETGGLDYSLQYQGMFSNRILFLAQAGSHSEQGRISPPDDQKTIYTIGATRAESTPSIRVRETEQRQLLGEPSLKFGPYAYSGKTEAQRRFVKASLEGAFGNHDVKVGAEVDPATYDQRLDYGWGTGMALEWAPGGLSRSGIPEQIIGVRRCWGDGKGGCLDWAHQVDASGQTKGVHAFAQDRWKVTPDIALNYGARWERQDVQDDSGRTLVSIDQISPRFGFVYDPSGKGTMKYYGSLGRFYDSIPMQVVSRAFAPRITSTRLYRGRDWTAQGFVSDISSNGICAANSASDDLANPGCWDFESADLAVNPNATGSLGDRVHTSRGVGSGSKVFRPDTIVDSGSLYRAPIDPDLEGASTKEAILGYDWQFRANWSAGIKLINRELDNAIEDISLDFGKNFIIANPGGPYRFFVDPANLDLWNPNYVKGSTDPTQQPTFAQLAGCRSGQVCELTNQSLTKAGFGGFPRATRQFKGLETTLAKQVSGGFWFNASYLLSRTRGNYRGRYFLENEERDPNLTEAFDTPALVVNTTGLLPQDRKHQFKFYGNLTLAKALDLGVTYRLASGTPYSLTTDPTGGSTPFLGPIYLLERGAAGRTPVTQAVDLRIAWSAQDTTKLKLTATLEFFNLFNEQKPVGVDEMFLAPGLWRNAFYSEVDGRVEFLQQGRGEPYDQYVDVRFGNGDGTVTRREWNAWAQSFQGRFDSARALYSHLKSETFRMNLNGASRVVHAYPGFEGCPSSLPSDLARCTALNSGYGSARVLETPRSVRLGLRLNF